MLSDDFSGMMGGNFRDAGGFGWIADHAAPGARRCGHVLGAGGTAAGALVKMELADQFWGDRYGQLVDPYGHVWSLGQTKAQLSDEQIKVASAALL